MSMTAQILAQLNSWTGDEPLDIWQELIYALPEYDQDATNRAHAYGYGASFGLTDGTYIAYDGQQRLWGVMDPGTGAVKAA
jgi:hypothetical protein